MDTANASGRNFARNGNRTAYPLLSHPAECEARILPVAGYPAYPPAGAWRALRRVSFTKVKEPSSERMSANVAGNQKERVESPGIVHIQLAIAKVG
jgi:hypothetical protein